MTVLPELILQKQRQLHLFLQQLERVAIALSGGVDSSLLLAEARLCLGDQAVAAVGVSASLAQRDLKMARAIAKFLNSPLIEINTHELEQQQYQQNKGDRCYFCKTELFQRIVAHERLNGAVLCDGSNADDDLTDRPGMKAAKEQQVASPLREAGFTKKDIRALARHHRLPNWDRPASPCLASRIQVGTRVDSEQLRHVEELEALIHAAGIQIFRMRVQQRSIVLEISADELVQPSLNRWLEPARRLASEFKYEAFFLNLVPYGHKLSEYCCHQQQIQQNS